MLNIIIYGLVPGLFISFWKYLLSNKQLFTNSGFRPICFIWRSYWIAKHIKMHFMKKMINALSIRALFAAILVLMVNIAVQAQDKVTVTHTETQTTSWISD